MTDNEKKRGYVEETFAFGKTGYIREPMGERYYYNSKSFDAGRKRLSVSESVIFVPGLRTDEKTGQTVPCALHVVSVTAALHAASEQLGDWNP